MKLAMNFASAIHYVQNQLRDYSMEFQGSRWQSSDVSKDPASAMMEVLNTSFTVMVQGKEDLDHFREDIKPNLPWADDHFAERVSGQPLNPGETWKSWPWALAADKHRKAVGAKFSHSYMERYWPKQAPEGRVPAYDDGEMAGIRYAYGDLNDVVNHLLGDPGSRQAYLPVWFPEDTGVVHGERVPCSLGYHWIQREGYLHTTYYIRSCDFTRHFRDDLYLTIRLTLWLLDQLRAGPGDFDWKNVVPGYFTFHCVSLHMFINDYRQLFRK